MKINQIDDSLALAAEIKAAIAKSGLKKKDIAEALGVKPQALTGWERTGRIHRSTLRDLGKLVSANLAGDDAGITDLHQETQAVIKMMEESDEEGRMRAKFAVSDTLNKYHGKKQTSGSELADVITNSNNEEMNLQIRNIIKLFYPEQSKRKQM